MSLLAVFRDASFLLFLRSAWARVSTLAFGMIPIFNTSGVCLQRQGVFLKQECQKALYGAWGVLRPGIETRSSGLALFTSIVEGQGTMRERINLVSFNKGTAVGQLKLVH